MFRYVVPTMMIGLQRDAPSPRRYAVARGKCCRGPSLKRDYLS